jgi:hypothetical protein
MLLTKAPLCVYKAGAISAASGCQETPVLLQRLLTELTRELGGGIEDRGLDFDLFPLAVDCRSPQVETSVKCSSSGSSINSSNSKMAT